MRSNRIKFVVLICSVFLIVSVFSSFGVIKASENEYPEDVVKDYPEGTVEIYGYGQPQYLLEYYNDWLERNRDIAPNVSIEITQTEGAADTREKITMNSVAGDYESLPDLFYSDPVNLLALAEGDLVQKVTNFVRPLEDKMVDGALNQATIDGTVYGMPASVRPQLIFYNKSILDKYNIDPARMDTMQGYIDVGRELKEKSDGEVYLSYIDPGHYTWRYYGRRGLMPQAEAKIWDDEGNPVIGTDPGAKLAFNTLDTMYSEGLLYKTEIFKPGLYDATNAGKIATFYIGAFWDEFLRKNCQETAGDWRVRPAPVFEDINLRGAPVTNYWAIANKPNGEYDGLVKKLWYDFNFDKEPREVWVKSMVEQNAPYANPISLEMLKDEFWKKPSPFYGGQSFRKMEGEGLVNGAPNLRITPQSAEADVIISAQLERYVAGDQTIDEAIEAMQKNLEDKIGQAESF